MSQLDPIVVKVKGIEHLGDLPEGFDHRTVMKSYFDPLSIDARDTVIIECPEQFPRKWNYENASWDLTS